MENFKVTPQNIETNKFEFLQNSNKRLSHIDLKYYNPKWLIPNFILKNTLVSFYAMPGSGKSITSLFLGLYLLKNNQINKIYYIDADNGYATLKNRGLEQILKDYPNLIYISQAKKTQQSDIDFKKLIFELSNSAKNGTVENDLIIIDSIRNFISGNMSYDNEVMPILDALQSLRDYSAGVWFLNHQNKQNLANDENNKAYKGATAFFDSPDEAYFVKKRERKENSLIVTLEPMKQRDDTLPQALIIDTLSTNIYFDDYFIYAMNEKQSQSLEYAKDIIFKNPSGINLQNLVTEIKRMSKIDEVEICGMNALKKLLKQFDGRFYEIKLNTTSYNSLIFKPL